jgi:DNA-binding MarR family transcriptional regulator
MVNTSFQAKQNLTSAFQKAGFDTTVDQFTVMGAIIGEKEITQRQICEKSCKNDANLTRILKGMESKGLVFRQKGKDARSRNVYLSDEGKQLFASLVPIAEEYMHRVFTGLSEEEEKLLEQMLLKVREKL